MDSTVLYRGYAIILYFFALYFKICFSTSLCSSVKATGGSIHYTLFLHISNCFSV